MLETKLIPIPKKKDSFFLKLFRFGKCICTEEVEKSEIRYLIEQLDNEIHH